MTPSPSQFPYACARETGDYTYTTSDCETLEKNSKDLFVHTYGDACLCLVAKPAVVEGKLSYSTVQKVWAVRQSLKALKTGPWAVPPIDDFFSFTKRPARDLRVDPTGLTLLTLSERVDQGVAQAIASFGLVAIYTLIITSFAKALRLQRHNTVKDIVYEDHNAVKFVYQLCQDIYAARKFGALDDRYFHLEERLWHQMENLFRDTAQLVDVAARTRRELEETARTHEMRRQSRRDPGSPGPDDNN